MAKLPRNELIVMPPSGEETIREIKSLEGKIDDVFVKAIKVGELLVRVKSELMHGDFTPWIKQNIPRSKTRCYIYINAYKNLSEVKGIKSPEPGRLLELKENGNTIDSLSKEYGDIKARRKLAIW